MKKMLYIMGVEWNWIFQRPQILALRLQENYEVTVICPKQLIQKKHQKNKPPNRLVELVQIPFQEKNRLIGFLADKWHRHKIGDFSGYDIVWVGYPLFGRYIPKDYHGMVVYDCMDNFEALYPDQRRRAVAHVLAREKELLCRADIVLASAEKLKEKLLMACPGKRIELIRNGYSNVSIRPPRQGEKKEKYTLGYIGTISKWLDDGLLKASLAENEKINYRLVGPVSGHQMIEDARVTYSGVIAHEKLSEYVNEIDCLIMPFIISEIVLYVDPVKLYEYIAWGKCIISSWYPEIDRFQDYVYFYRDKEEYLQVIKKLANEGFPPKYTQEQQQDFLSKNTWEERVRVIEEIINRKGKSRKS